MAFASIPPVPRAQEIIDGALRAGRKSSVRSKRGDDRVAKRRKKERERLVGISTDLRGRLKSFSHQFPSYDDLNEFYRSLFANDIDVDRYRQTLGRIHGTAEVVSAVARSTRGRMDAAQSVDEIHDAMNACIGRTCSAVEKLDDDLVWLEQVRETIQDYPVVKETFTVCIAGFPNVGKTTLFAELTGSQAEVNSYAFTTKRLNVGYLQVEHHKVQFIDTPGTLNRDRMNPIERQADLALKYLADVILYLYDPTEQYSKEQQEALREHMQEYNAPVYDFVTKTDLVTDEQLAAFLGEKRVLSKEEFLDVVKKSL